MLNNGNQQPLLRAEEISTGYGRGQVLFDVSFELYENEVVSLMGRNGMGKTTLIRTIMGLLPQRTGKIIFNEHITRSMPVHRIAALGIGWVPEGRIIFPSLTVEENLLATAQSKRKGPAVWDLQRIYRLFPRLQERRRNWGNQLSGGEQQMLAIGRALMTNPRLLILDEATEGLAPNIRQEIWATLEKIKNEGQSLLVVDKDIKALGRLANKHYMIEKGRIVWEGNSSALQADSELVRQYVGI